MTEQRTNKQVEAIIFQVVKEEPLLLMMKRVPAKGGFWQPLTGGVRVGESLTDALVREVGEETGITDVMRIIDTGYTFCFTDNGRDYEEFVFGVEVRSGVPVKLSVEHEEYEWASKERALSLLKWEGNIEGVTRLSRLLELE